MKYLKKYSQTNEAFFYRTDDKLSNLIQSFKNLFLNLKLSTEERHRLDFFISYIKKDLESYKDYLILNYKKENKRDFIYKFDSLIDEIDSDLVNEIKLKEFINSISNIFKHKGPIDSTSLKLNELFDNYVSKFNDRIESLIDIFNKKILANEFYEPLNNINISSSEVSFEEYNKQKYLLQIELVKLQEWIIENKKKILILFEGRDGAGKGSGIKTFTENLNPKNFRIETFGIPTEYEKKHWFKRYEEELPKKGEIVFFDRSWYNRAYLEPVMGYCSDKQYKEFMDDVNDFEEKLVNDQDIMLIKIWFSVSKDTQKLKFELRKSNPLKYWKYSKNDSDSINKWDNFTWYINKMFKKTNTKVAPWFVIDSNDERNSKLLAMKKVLSKFDYTEREQNILKESVNSDTYIFLDIDGVLMQFDTVKDINHAEFAKDHNWSQDAINNINELVKDINPKVIISSSYRKIKTKEEIQKRFNELGINVKIHGFTEVIPNVKRGGEILKYIEDHNIKRYIIIDDRKHNFDSYFKSDVIVRPHTNIGFSKQDLQKALSEYQHEASKSI